MLYLNWYEATIANLLLFRRNTGNIQILRRKHKNRHTFSSAIKEFGSKQPLSICCWNSKIKSTSSSEPKSRCWKCQPPLNSTNSSCRISRSRWTSSTKAATVPTSTSFPAISSKNHALP